jgi:hypothetical protein
MSLILGQSSLRCGTGKVPGGPGGLGSECIVGELAETVVDVEPARIPTTQK